MSNRKLVPALFVPVAFICGCASQLDMPTRNLVRESSVNAAIINQRAQENFDQFSDEELKSYISSESELWNQLDRAVNPQ